MALPASSTRSRALMLAALASILLTSFCCGACFPKVLAVSESSVRVYDGRGVSKANFEVLAETAPKGGATFQTVERTKTDATGEARFEERWQRGGLIEIPHLIMPDWPAQARRLGGSGPRHMGSPPWMQVHVADDGSVAGYLAFDWNMSAIERASRGSCGALLEQIVRAKAYLAPTEGGRQMLLAQASRLGFSDEASDPYAIALRAVQPGALDCRLTVAAYDGLGQKIRWPSP